MEKFLVVEANFFHSSPRSITHILMEDDFIPGLFKSIDLVAEDLIYKKQLDYINIPFQYGRCQLYGHVIDDDDDD